MARCLRNCVLVGLLLAVTLSGTLSLSVAAVPQDACALLTTADFKALGVSATPTNRVANTPSQSMVTCAAGSMAAPPMLSLMVQDIKVPIAVEMGRKRLASEKGDDASGPWDTGKAISGADGVQFHFFKGNVSVLIMTNSTKAEARSTLTEIAKRVAKAL
jgi:hypothetical protein